MATTVTDRTDLLQGYLKVKYSITYLNTSHGTKQKYVGTCGDFKLNALKNSFLKSRYFNRYLRLEYEILNHSNNIHNLQCCTGLINIEIVNK